MNKGEEKFLETIIIWIRFFSAALTVTIIIIIRLAFWLTYDNEKEKERKNKIYEDNERMVSH